MLIGYICKECKVYHRMVNGIDPCPNRQEKAFLNLVGKDKLFDFVTQGVHPKLPAGIHITSAKQWERVQRKYGVTADLSLRERMQRRQSGLAERVRRERQKALQQRIRPVIESAFREQHTIRMA